MSITLEQLYRTMVKIRKEAAELDDDAYLKDIKKEKKDRIKEIFSNFITTNDYKNMDTTEFLLKLNEFVESQEL